MDYLYAYSDKPDCDAISCNPDDGEWPGDWAVSVRGMESEDTGSFDTETETSFENSYEQPHGTRTAGTVASKVEIEKRKESTATISHKKVAVCGQEALTSGLDDYPSFPSNQKWAWEGIQKNKWDSVSRYWGNESAICSDWSVTWLQPADTETLGNTQVRAKYQSRLDDESYYFYSANRSSSRARL
jgi:chitinase